MPTLEALITGAVSVFFKTTFAPTFEEVLAKVRKQVDEAEAKLPKVWVKDGVVVPEGTEGAELVPPLGLGDGFVEKIARAEWDKLNKDGIIEGLVAAAVKVVKDGKGPIRKNHVDLA